MKEEFKTTAIGVMSGTSLDGLDICYADFQFDGNWSFEIKNADCIDYSDEWKEILSSAHLLSEPDLENLHLEYGRFIGNQVCSFSEDKNLPQPKLVCSHGHTVLHEPAKGITLQIGDGQEIANITGITCISDFRSLDVSLGGQGAPLVPIGDRLLFPKHKACLNLGGFSNISFEEGDERIAFDICPVNIVLNELSQKLGKPFDEDGNLAKSGNLNEDLLTKLNGLALYHESERPSLAREWVESDFDPVLERYSISVHDKLRTLVEHVAFQISNVINLSIDEGNVLVTGGGAKNSFLMDRLSNLSKAQIIIPNDQIVDYKEALIFAFLGILLNEGKTNVLRSVTGASRDSSSGVIHRPIQAG